MFRRILLSGSRSEVLRFVLYWGVVVLLFGSIGAAAGRLILPEDDSGRPPPGPLIIGRQKIDPENSVEEEARQVARAFRQGKITLHSGSFERQFTRERLGLRFNQEEAVRLITAWRDPESSLRRYREASAVRGPIAVPVPMRLDVEVATRTLLALKEEFDTAAADAHIDLGKKRIIREKAGRKLEIYGSMAKLAYAARSEADRVELAVVEFPPRVQAKALEGVRFEEVLGFFETPYSQMRKDRHRTYNLKLAAKSLDGQILMPGKLMSFNEVVGERSEARGYRVASVIAAGQLVDGMGGGTCQIAGTLHAAAFFAGLEIVEREPHSRPSSYIRVGLDATVSYPNIDLKLRNPFDLPVVIGMAVEDGTVRGEIRGAKRELTVTYIRNILDTKEPPTRRIEDDTMPAGVTKVEQRGVPGFTVRRFRIFRKGTIQWRHQGIDRYPPTSHIVRVGTNTALTPVEEETTPPQPFKRVCNMRIIQGPGGLHDEQTACQD